MSVHPNKNYTPQDRTALRFIIALLINDDALTQVFISPYASALMGTVKAA